MRGRRSLAGGLWRRRLSLTDCPAAVEASEQRAERGARSEVSRSERPSDARSAERGAVGTAAGFRPPTARLRLGRPSDARSAERGEPMPARLRVRRRSLNAPRARRSLPCCLRRRRLQPADLPAAFVRRPSDARSAERGARKLPVLDTVVTRWCRGRLLRFQGGTPVGRPCVA